MSKEELEEERVENFVHLTILGNLQPDRATVLSLQRLGSRKLDRMDHGSMALCSLTGQLGWADSNLAARNWTRWTKKNVIWKARLMATKPPHNKVELEEKIL